MRALNFNPKLPIIDLVCVAGVWMVPPVLEAATINEELNRVLPTTSTTVPELPAEAQASVDD